MRTMPGRQQHMCVWDLWRDRGTWLAACGLSAHCLWPMI